MDNMPKYILRILSGSHTGAEVMLYDGDHVIGSHENCDIILSDSSVKPEHIKFTVNWDEVYIVVIEGSCFLDGDPISDETVVSAFQVITLGQIHMAIGPGDKTWPEIELPLPSAAETQRTSDDQGAAPPVLMDEKSEAVPEKRKNRRLSWKVPVILIIPLAAIFLFIIFTGASHQPKDEPIDPKTALANILKEEVYRTLSISEGSSGTYSIQGYLDRTVQRQKLTRQIYQIGIPVALRVYSGEELAASCNDFFKRSNQDVAAIYQGAGEILLQGKSKDAQAVDRTIALIKQDLPGIRQIINQVAISELPPEEVLPVVVNQTAQPQTITPVPKPRKIERPSLPILSVSMGKIPSVVLENRMRYFEGSHIGNGFFIERIYMDRILLKKGNQVLTYKIGGQ